MTALTMRGPIGEAVKLAPEPKRLLLEFFVPGRAVGKQRARTVTRGKGGAPLPFARTYTPEKTANYEQWILHCALEAGARVVPLDEPLDLDLDICLPAPSTWSGKRKTEAFYGLIKATKKPDSSNVLKSIEDALNGIVWRDDSLIVDVRVRKRYAEIVGVHVRISAAGGRCAP